MQTIGVRGVAGRHDLLLTSQAINHRKGVEGVEGDERKRRAGCHLLTLPQVTLFVVSSVFLNSFYSSLLGRMV